MKTGTRRRPARDGAADPRSSKPGSSRAQAGRKKAAAKIRDRIIEFRRVPASELEPNPLNWRVHNPQQRDALKGVIEEIGYAGAALAYKTPGGGLRLIDGHLRAESDPNGKIPTLILDVDETEAKKLLTTFDPLGAMAGADAPRLDALLKDVATNSPALQEMLAELAAQSGLFLQTGDNDPHAEWQGMPEYSHEDLTAFRTIKVHFADQTAVDKFAKLIGQKLTPQSRFIWFPEMEIASLAETRYASKS
jgi:hypothetical protein